MPKRGAQIEFYDNSDSKRPKPADLTTTQVHFHRLADGRMGRRTVHCQIAADLTDDAGTATEAQHEDDALVDTGNLDLHNLDLCTNADEVNVIHAKPVKHRSEYLDELLRYDGRADHPIGTPCTGCKKNEPEFRCVDCLCSSMYCEGCLRERHKGLPLHRIQRWTGTFFEKTTLYSIGLRVQLGHGGDTCTKPQRGRALTVIDTSGIHNVHVDYCECGHSSGSTLYRVQLLRMRWFPATLLQPQTVMTFDALDMFHILTHQSKITFYDFYQTLVRKTDGSGVQVVPDRYKKGMLCVLIWRHLNMLKRSGRGHDPLGIDNTPPGGCAVECPACPHPGRNLPDGWQDAPANERWNNSSFLLIDRGIKDPELGSGWAYFVEKNKYQEVLNATPDAPVINECQSNLHAVDHANTRFQKGYVTTGVGSVVCARHALVRKGGVTDLQKGEKYVNMDYAFLSTLIGVVCTSLIVTYDIACQWSKNFKQRMLAFPAFMHLNIILLAMFFGIPKFHLPAHGPACHTKGVGRTDGEGVEREWAHINAVATSTREMGAGSRHTTLDDHWGGWNWQKVIGLGILLLAKLKEAIENQAKQKTLFREFSATFSAESITKWDEMIEAWHADSTKPDPYKDSAKATTLADVRLALVNDEAVQAASGNLALHNVTPSSFLHTGLDLEEQQLRSKDAETTTSSANLQERRNALRRRIEVWRNIQVPELRNGGCLQGLHDMEFRLRHAQAGDALNQLRQQLRIQSRLRDYKKIQVSGPGQRVNTRARNLISRFHQKSLRCAERYRDAYSALLALDPGGAWQQHLHKLMPEDIRGPGHGDEDDIIGHRRAYGHGVGQGFHEHSWIWTVSQPLSEGLQSEYAKSKARAERWDEEVILLVEEMRRSVAFLKWRSETWHAQRGSRADAPQDISLGLDAYAAYQSHMLIQLASRFCRMWLNADWARQFLSDHASVNADTDSSADSVDIDSDNE
ncbi:hypothetical protein BD410DRAFT_815199 [Rickenella mellea]|uniref:CxC2-like cysteine cluster KDZ transposase-associated domain-containing protein n=1 Tax=Rickenella mellea TaxID=50990 RepID=A0A4Y7Q4A5_9AGAM|nr:hypothetical protein BD410DRAFT_815199 [Rickenella mellea]